MQTEDRYRLLGLLKSLSAADRSLLQAAIDQLDTAPQTLLTTTPGSSNERLWAAMSTLGLMKPVEPLNVPVASRVYVIEPSAAEEISRLLADNEHGDVMVKIVNDFRERIPPLLTEAVHGSNGTPFDLAMILGCIVESTMRRAIKPELYDEFLAQVAKIASGMRTPNGR